MNRIDGAAHTPSDSPAPAVAVGIDCGAAVAPSIPPFGTTRTVPHAALEAQVPGSSPKGRAHQPPANALDVETNQVEELDMTFTLRCEIVGPAVSGRVRLN